MKGKLGFFIFGLFVGAVLTVFAFLIYSVGLDRVMNSVGIDTSNSTVSRSQIDGLTYFDSEGATIPALQVRVFQTLGTNYALAESTNERYTAIDGYNYSKALTILLVNDGEYSIYDDLRIDIPSTKKLVQIGTFKYQTVDNQWKTVPVVKIK